MKKFSIFILLIACMAFSTTTFAQNHQDGNHDDGHKKDYDHGTSVPIDNGIVLLLLAGSCIGAGVLYKKFTPNLKS